MGMPYALHFQLELPFISKIYLRQPKATKLSAYISLFKNEHNIKWGRCIFQLYGEGQGLLKKMMGRLGLNVKLKFVKSNVKQIVFLMI